MVTRGGVLAIVPARGGSKGVPRKNLRLLGDHPLIAWSIAAGQAASLVDRVLVTTDDPEIRETAQAYGAETPFLRPAELAQDDTTDWPVFDHALAWLAEHEGYEPSLVVHLRPTSPLRLTADIDRAVALIDEGGDEADSVRGVCQPFQNPFKMWRIGDSGFLEPLIALDMPEPFNQPHQRLPPVYWQAGYIDVIRTRTIREQRSMTGRRIRPLHLSKDSWVDIDTEANLAFAVVLIRRGAPGVAKPTLRTR